jgi:hypothetical protein
MLKQQAINDFSFICSANPSAVVQIAFNGNTVTALRTSKTTDAMLEDMGETGGATSAIYCKADDIAGLVQGDTITFGAAEWFVMAIETDPMSALSKLTIRQQYTETTTTTLEGEEEEEEDDGE